MIDLNGIKLKNRILWAAGVWGHGLGWPWERWLTKIIIPGYGRLADPASAGAVVTKTLTLEPNRGGYIDPFEFERRSLVSHLSHMFSEERSKVLIKVPGGWMNNMQWWNVGVDYWLKEIYPRIDKNVAIIPNIGGFSTEDYLQLIEKLNPLNIVAIEINISCPNVKKTNELKRSLADLFRTAKRISQHPLVLKIGSQEEDISLAQTAAALGFNAVSGINAILGAIITPAGIFEGGQSGRRIKETALETILKLKEALQITATPIIGGGGITSWKDCQKFLEVADAIALGSVGFNPFKPTWLAKKQKSGNF